MRSSGTLWKEHRVRSDGMRVPHVGRSKLYPAQARRRLWKMNRWQRRGRDSHREESGSDVHHEDVRVGVTWVELVPEDQTDGSPGVGSSRKRAQRATLQSGGRHVSKAQGYKKR